jgi:NTP pyrophosphatase (non-canonical NTP hydrolase)
MSQTDLLNALTRESSLTQIQEYVDKVVEKRGFKGQPVQEAVLLLLEEVGELAKAIRIAATKMSVDPDKIKEYGTVESEAADVFFVLTAICNEMGINLFDALKEKEKKNCERVWSFER